MFFDILKRDLKRKKTMNIIILLFICDIVGNVHFVKRDESDSGDRVARQLF